MDFVGGDGDYFRTDNGLLRRRNEYPSESKADPLCLGTRVLGYESTWEERQAEKLLGRGRDSVELYREQREHREHEKISRMARDSVELYRDEARWRGGERRSDEVVAKREFKLVGDGARPTGKNVSWVD